jgi:hypothetical protein
MPTASAVADRIRQACVSVKGDRDTSAPRHSFVGERVHYRCGASVDVKALNESGARAAGGQSLAPPPARWPIAHLRTNGDVGALDDRIISAGRCRAIRHL